MSVTAGVPAGWQPTDIGILPSDWDVACVGDHDVFVTSGSRGWAAFYANQGALFVRITNLSRERICLNLTDTKFVSLSVSATEGARTRLREHDVLISITADIGIIGYIDASIPSPAYINQHIALVRFNPSRVCARFVAYFLASETPQRAFRSITDTGAKAGLSLVTVRKLQTAFPPLKEQKAIADALGDVDTLLDALDRLIAKKRDLKQAAMQQLLTARTRLPGFTGEWQTRTLLECSDSLDNIRVPLNDTQRSKMKGGYPYCGANGVLDHVNDFVIDDDIVLMAEDGGYFDEYRTRPIAYRMKGKCWINNHAHVLKAKPDFDQGFLFYSLVHKDVTDYLASGTRAKLNKSEMMKIPVLFAPTMDEQIAIATVLSDMDAEIAALEDRRAKARDLKQAMMQELLTGKTRLI